MASTWSRAWFVETNRPRNSRRQPVSSAMVLSLRFQNNIRSLEPNGRTKNVRDGKAQARANLRGLHDIHENRYTAQEGVGRWVDPWSLANIFSSLSIYLPGFRRRRQLVVCTKPDAASVNVPSENPWVQRPDHRRQTR